MSNISFQKQLSYTEFDATESKIDTDYFGIASAKVTLKKACKLKQRQIDLLNFLQDFEFISITNKSNNSFNNRWLGEKTKAFLTDMNIQLAKKVSIMEESNNGLTEIIDNFPGSKRMIRIAETSFRYSRFLNDPYLPIEKAKCIYGDITKNAFGKPGRFFAIIKSAQEIIGYLLFSINLQALSSTIELVAIDQNYQGRAIGRSLMRSIENYVGKMGMETIKVGTQLDNVDALMFYTSYGFKYFECHSIYHYWPSKP